MNFTLKTAAQSLLILAASMTAVAQSEIAPDHFPDPASSAAFTPHQESQALQERLERYQKELRAKSELVENAWQVALSAPGDFSGPYIAEYLQQKDELDRLQAALTPQIEQARTAIANLNISAALSDTALSPNVRPARPARAVVTASKSHEIH